MRGSSVSKRIGIFAGSFDPVHEGHLAFAHSGLAHGLDKVYFLVEPRPRRKQGVHALEHRLEMAKLAAASHKKLGVIHLEQNTFSPLATLPVLQARFKDSELVLLFGDDVVSHMVDHLADWPHVSELAKHTSLLIATRHHKKDDLTDRLNAVMDYGVHFRYEFVEPGQLAASSSDIRLALKRGNPPTGLPPAVLDYISREGIYSSTGAR